MTTAPWQTDDVFVIAEVGNNHEGRFDVAQELVAQAAAAGASAVKFQTFKTELFVSPKDSARFARLKGFELTYDQFAALASQAKGLGLLFISTPLDLESAAFLGGIVDAMKIASGDNRFYPLIDLVCELPVPLILSTGLSDLDDVRALMARARTRRSADSLALLHCVSSYPVPPAEAQLGAIAALASEFDCAVGYSDHTLGIEACLAAVALGARIVEKHFTLDRNYSDFRDHQLSADPADMARLVEGVRHVRALVGNRGKVPQDCERDGMTAMRRSVAAIKALPAGHTLVAADLMWIRPGTGIAPGQEATLIGRRLARGVEAAELLSLDALEQD